MPNPHRENKLQQPAWKYYQTKIQRIKALKRSFRAILTCFFLSLILFFAGYQIFDGHEAASDRSPDKTAAAAPPALQDNNENTARSITKREVRQLLQGKSFLNLDEKDFIYHHNGQQLKVTTSLDMPLQRYMLKKMDMSHARVMGFVAMDPTTGQILSMIGQDKTDPKKNPCVDGIFPAASIFKIVTAAAAVEKMGIVPDSTFFFNGKKHTLYKNQINKQKTKYTHQTTFKDSFAQSVNPVFGKIGALSLGKAVLENYAEVFGFNRNIDFEIPLLPSVISISEDLYNLAEIASGFNRATQISPLHGALLASIPLNQGALMAPTIIERIVDEKFQTVYLSRKNQLNHAISPAASKIVARLMLNTITNGTGKKGFRRYKTDRVLSNLTIGGKTGSIGDKTNEARFDWFVGFAQDKKGGKKIAVSVLVIHEKYIGVKAIRYARMAIQQYFRNDAL
ncbi:MAG: penicillin-binding transpeptidase domain-containing protein [Desulfobacterales bacterium]|nr:penicillin-binding transpeptidase domain-containing protein [Desulfobacterales bacterium]